MGSQNDIENEFNKNDLSMDQPDTFRKDMLMDNIYDNYDILQKNINTLSKNLKVVPDDENDDEDQVLTTMTFNKKSVDSLKNLNQTKQDAPNYDIKIRVNMSNQKIINQT